MKLLQLRWLDELNDSSDEESNWKNIKEIPYGIDFNEAAYIEWEAGKYINACRENGYTNKIPMLQLRIINVQ